MVLGQVVSPPVNGALNFLSVSRESPFSLENKHHSFLFDQRCLQHLILDECLLLQWASSDETCRLLSGWKEPRQMFVGWKIIIWHRACHPVECTTQQLNQVFILGFYLEFWLLVFFSSTTFFNYSKQLIPRTRVKLKSLIGEHRDLLSSVYSPRIDPRWNCCYCISRCVRGRSRSSVLTECLMITWEDGRSGSESSTGKDHEHESRWAEGRTMEWKERWYRNDWKQKLTGKKKL